MSLSDGDTESIIENINRYEPTSTNVRDIDSLISRLYASGHPEQGLQALLGVFERFPEDDGDPHWSIMHAIEHIAGFETYLARSLQQKPSIMGLLMVRRMMRAGETHAGDIGLDTLLQGVAADPTASRAIRDRAQELILARNKRGS